MLLQHNLCWHQQDLKGWVWNSTKVTPQLSEPFPQLYPATSLPLSHSGSSTVLCDGTQRWLLWPQGPETHLISQQLYSCNTATFVHNLIFSTSPLYAHFWVLDNITEQCKYVWSPTWSLYTKQGPNLSFQYQGTIQCPYSSAPRVVFILSQNFSLPKIEFSLLKHTDHQIACVLVQLNLQNPKSSFTTDFKHICHPVGNICCILLSSASTVQEWSLSLRIPALELGWFSIRRWSWPTQPKWHVHK